MNNKWVLDETIYIAEKAEDAPVGKAWAKTDEWTPFNTAKTDAKAVYDNYDATQNMVLNAMTALDKANNTFQDAVSRNGPGTNTSSLKTAVTITGIAGLEGKEFKVYISDNADHDPASTIARSRISVKVSGGTLTVDSLIGPDDNDWLGSGSRHIVIELMEFVEFAGLRESGLWVSTDPHNFANPKANLTWTQMRKLGYGRTVLDLARMMSPDIEAEDLPSMKLDDLLNYFSSNPGVPFPFTSYQSFLDIMKEAMNMSEDILRLYKDKFLTQPYSGSDVVDASTRFYSIVPWWNFLIDGVPPSEYGDQTGLLEGDITFTNVPPEGMELWIMVSGNSWQTEWSPTFDISGNNTTEHWELPLYADYNFMPGNTSFTFNVRPRSMNTNINKSYLHFHGYEKNVTGENYNVGIMGIIDCSYIVLSGTIDADYPGVPDKVYISADNQIEDYGQLLPSGDVELEPTEKSWKLALPKAALPNASNSIKISVSNGNDYRSVVKTIDIPNTSTGVSDIHLGTVVVE